MSTPIAELTVQTTAEFVGIVGSSIERSVGVVTYPAKTDRFGRFGPLINLCRPKVPRQQIRYGCQKKIN